MIRTPWPDLTEELILTTIESALGIPLAGLCIKRNSYINRVFEIERRDTKTRMIVKFYRPGRWTSDQILTEHALLNTLAERDIPVIPPLRFQDTTLHTSHWDTGPVLWCAFEKKGGRPYDELTPDQWEQIGRVLGRLHSLTATIPAANRIVWTPETATRGHLQILEASFQLNDQTQRVLTNLTNRMFQHTKTIFQDCQKFTLHGDCHLGNLLYRPDDGIYLLDFDDLSVGPAIQDIWMLLPGTPDECEQELGYFRSGYTVFRDFPYSELKLIPYLRIMRMIHFAAWCALQQHDVSFPDHFPDWGTQRYWNELIRDIQTTLESI